MESLIADKLSLPETGGTFDAASYLKPELAVCLDGDKATLADPLVASLAASLARSYQLSTDEEYAGTIVRFCRGICDLRSASCDLRAASCELRSGMCELGAAICDFRSAIWELRSAIWGDLQSGVISDLRSGLPRDPPLVIFRSERCKGV